MRLSSSMKLGSFLLCVVAALAGVAMGCGEDRSGDFTGGPPPEQALSPNPQKVAIDTGATLSSKGGDGVGVFVQYASGGHWTLTTACDTNTSGQPCGFDLFVAGIDASTILSNPTGTTLEAGDVIEVLPDGSIHLQTVTSTGLDGITLDTTAGATLDLVMYLDGLPQPQFIYWIGDKVLHTGAPTDPINLAPSAN
jgi:hypothetical protein